MRIMARTWVLDTETKGTGAHVVPLEKKLERPAASREPRPKPPKRRAPRPAPPPEPRQPLRFKVVDVMTQEVLAEGASARATVDVLERLGSVVDVRMYVWEPKAERWRLLAIAEQKALWGFRGRQRADAQPRRAAQVA
jgi:hypothetical protein